MNDRHHITPEEMHAFIDGELDAARTADVRAARQRDEAFARQLAGFMADKERLNQVYGPLIHRPIPSAWLDKIAAFRLEQEPAPSRRGLLAMAASVAAIAGGVLAYRQFARVSNEAIVAEAVAAHGAAKNTPTLGDPSGALGAALNLSLKAPDLSRMGFTLAGLQVLDAAHGRKAAALSYRDKADRLFTVYLTPSPGAPHFDMLKQGDVRICVWQDDVLSAVMVADMSAAEMLRLASLAYSGLPA